ncbi:unnamed protein product, partial [marine sediment metagenome]
PENVDDCKAANSDIIKTPSEVPLSDIAFADLNSPSKTLVRRLFIALAKKTLGRVRGKFSGVVSIPDAERVMDYDTLLSEGNDEYNQVMERLDEYLEDLSPEKQIARAAQEAEDLNKHLKYRPLGFDVK